MRRFLPALSFSYIRTSDNGPVRGFKCFEDLCRMLTAKGNSPLSGPFGDELRILVVLVYSLPVVFNSMLDILVCTRRVMCPGDNFLCISSLQFPDRS